VPYQIRPYKPQDKTTVLDLLRSNTPEFFAPAEEQEFIHYLDNEVEDYFVVEQENKTIGAGGINYFENERTARISWDIIDPNMQGKGVGKQLTQHRINYIKNKNIDIIVVRTSQMTYEFYEKMGFKLSEVAKDYWAEGFDLYLMKRRS
jgi:N-acetylglutamate synthase-like GNAT family acetyltransferase